MASTEPDERSIPPVMMTCVIPTAMMPTTETCRMMMLMRCGLRMKLSPRTTHPRISKMIAMTIRPRKTLNSGGRERRRG